MAYVYWHGEWVRRAGAIHIFLRHKDIPPYDQKNNRIAQLVGVVLLLSPDGDQVITAYRNRDGLRDIRRKARYERRRLRQ